jgi:hypothetical protein
MNANVYVMHRVPGSGERVEWESIPKKQPFVTVDYAKFTADYSAHRQRRFGVTYYWHAKSGYLQHSQRGWFGSLETAMNVAHKVAAAVKGTD